MQKRELGDRCPICPSKLLRTFKRSLLGILVLPCVLDGISGWVTNYMAPSVGDQLPLISSGLRWMAKSDAHVGYVGRVRASDGRVLSAVVVPGG